MLSYLVHFVKLLMPGSRTFLLVTVTLAALLLFQPCARGRTIARALLAIVVAGYWLLSVPAVADAIQSGFPNTHMWSAASGGDAAIVVLSAGIYTFRIGGDEISVPTPQSAYNVLAGAELFRQMGAPWVIVSGGGIADASRQRTREADVLAPLLREYGVPEDRIVREESSDTTHSQAINVAQLAKRRGFGTLIIVTSPAHLPRAVGAFRAQGVDAVGYAARFRSDQRLPASRWLPSSAALGAAQEAIYDHLGWVYYRSRGWLATGSR